MTKTAITLIATLTAAGCASLTPPLAVNPVPVAAQAAAKAADPAKFYAHADIEAKAPGAFALQAESATFLTTVARTANAERDALVKAIQADSTVAAAVQQWPQLSWEEQLPILKRIMTLESKAMGFTQPPLVIGEGTSRECYFDFDPAHPGTGTVMLYPESLKADPNPYASLILTIHETRHAGQFQSAFGQGRKQEAAAVTAGYRAAFNAQKQLGNTLSFCDFCSLLNEYEAFQSANYIVGRLTGWKADTHDMGCLSSQYDANGRLIIDLVKLGQTGGWENLLDAFNDKEKAQFSPTLKAIGPTPQPSGQPYPAPQPPYGPHYPCTANPLNC